MKLANITLKDFRGFPFETTFHLDGGKNLLLYGENGSGKSSLFRALLEFFNRSPRARSFGWYRNVFSSGKDLSAIEGNITLESSNGDMYEWKCLGRRPITDPHQPSLIRERLTDAANRAAFLDYRSLLRTNFGASDIKKRFFDLAVTTLLANVSVPVAGRERTIGQLWASLQNAVPGYRQWQTKSRLASIATAEKAFNDALRGVLPEVQERAAELLSYFDHSSLELKLAFSGVSYEQYTKSFAGQKLDFEVKLHEIAIPEWNDLLNEARLTALALSLYLAGAMLSNTTPPPSMDTPLRLLVLDDVLIGLDLGHRLPMLKIIEELMKDYQVFLLTHDRVWFDLAQLSISNPDNWVCYEIYSREARNAEAVFDCPVLMPQATDLAEHFISMAKTHMSTPNHDHRAAALYTRAAFEVKLKRYCSNKKVQVAYDLDGRNLNTDHFLDAIERRFVWTGAAALTLLELQRVKLFREGVLNPSAHFHPVTLAKSEVDAAIRAVKALSFSKETIDFAKRTDELLQKASPSRHDLDDAANLLRTAFERDLRGLLLRLEGTVRFRDDWSKIGLAELWDSAKAKMTALNSSLATPLIADIEAHALVFLNDWTYATVVALNKANLDAAWDALRDTASAAPKTRLASFA